MNLALTSYVLVDEHNVPVPLPFHTRDFDGAAITVLSFEPSPGSGRIVCDTGRYFPHVLDLRVISENEYMARQAGREPFHLIDPVTGTEVTLPHYLPDDQTVTSIDREFLVCETTRSITWLDPNKYGLSIIADCDLQVLA